MPGPFGMFLNDGSEHGGLPTHPAATASRAKSKSRVTTQRIKALEANLAKTLMICESLWELLQEKTGLTLEEFHKKLYEVDMRDGVLDGKNQRKASQCPNCQHMVSPRHPACIYCGRVMDESVFSMD
jgi:hypothetical protein